MTIKNERTCLPGEKAEVAGVYMAMHGERHRQSHELVLLAGQVFPRCQQCSGQVRFQLLRAAPYLFDDQDFRATEEDRVGQRARGA